MTDSTEPTFSRQIAHPDRRKVVAVALASLAVLAAAAVTMGASPGPSTAGADPSAAARRPPRRPSRHRLRPAHARRAAERRPRRVPRRLRAVGRVGDVGGPGIGRLGGVEITAIDGSDLVLETVDGWTRTITVTDDTEITKGGDPIELGRPRGRRLHPLPPAAQRRRDVLDHPDRRRPAARRRAP